MKRVMVDMSATLIHHGHTRLIAQAAEHGEVVIGLTSDEEIWRNKGYQSELSFNQRREVLLAMRQVDEVVETPWLITEQVLDQHDIDLLVHGEDNSNPIPSERLLVLPRTPSISSSELRSAALVSQVSIKNKRLMLTPGPAALIPENVAALEPVFGRGDENFAHISAEVHRWLLDLSGQDEIVSMQGSATLALELGIKSLLGGRCLLVDTGYYASRMGSFVQSPCTLDTCSYDDLSSIAGEYDWVLTCYTETSCAFLSDIVYLRAEADRLGARLFLDATASIGLEENHHLADAMAFSSCKGLLGFTGAAFVAYKAGLEVMVDEDHYYFNLETQRNHGVTGPYHALSSLHAIIPVHQLLVARMRASKELSMEVWAEYLTRSDHQPLLCTYFEATIEPLDDNIVLYAPRSDLSGSVLCHFGEIWSPEVRLQERIQMVATKNG
jgi:2-aminoethylphosphonate-pyruvate transaminase